MKYIVVDGVLILFDIISLSWFMFLDDGSFPIVAIVLSDIQWRISTLMKCCDS